MLIYREHISIIKIDNNRNLSIEYIFIYLKRINFEPITTANVEITNAVNLGVSTLLKSG